MLLILHFTTYKDTKRNVIMCVFCFTYHKEVGIVGWHRLLKRTRRKKKVEKPMPAHYLLPRVLTSVFKKGISSDSPLLILLIKWKYETEFSTVLTFPKNPIEGDSLCCGDRAWSGVGGTTYSESQPVSKGLDVCRLCWPYRRNAGEMGVEFSAGQM